MYSEIDLPQCKEYALLYLTLLLHITVFAADASHKILTDGQQRTMFTEQFYPEIGPAKP